MLHARYSGHIGKDSQYTVRWGGGKERERTEKTQSPCDTLSEILPPESKSPTRTFRSCCGAARACVINTALVLRATRKRISRVRLRYSQGTVKPDLRLESLNPVNTTIATGEAPNFGDTHLRLSGEIHEYEQVRELSPPLKNTQTHNPI